MELERPPPPPPARRIRRLLGVAAASGVAVSLVLGAFAVHTLRSLPPLPDPTRPGTPSVLFVTTTGEPFARRGVRRDPPVDVRALPEQVVEPFIAIEDRRFYRHHGVDLRGAARAALHDLRDGQPGEGGSTITQQLVKNVLLTQDRTLGRKAKEAVAALWLERRLSKDEILSRYLNTVYFGEGAYGLSAAARTYFGKQPEALSISEAALLAGLVKAPSELSPTDHPLAAWARERQVIAAMTETGVLTPAAAAALMPPKVLGPERLPKWGGYFADWLYPQVRASLPPGFGEVVVRTSLDGALQRVSEAAVRRGLASEGQRGHVAQAALVALRNDGSVAAMVGGRDYDESPFNRAVQARRQPGSTFKLFVYLAAFRAGAAPESQVSDGPVKIGNWSPANADHENHGVLTLEEAFARSSNIAAVRVSQWVGLPAVVRAARDLGVGGKLDPVPSLALGTSGVTLLDLTSAYAAFSAGAYPVRPSGASLTDAPPRTALDWSTEQQPMLELLRAAAEDGTGRAAALPIPVYGKTGTSQNYRDAVFVGFAGGLTVGVWAGNDDESPMARLSGGALPARIWREVMSNALVDQIAEAQAQAASQGAPVEPEAPHEDPSWPGWLQRLQNWFGV